MTDWQLKTPVAFFIFNRPETTRRVFAEIARAKPPKLLIIADGARKDRPGEAERCAAARAVVEKIDWPCEALTHYSDRNLGCKNRVSSGLDWVFSQVEEAIILEDDCLPHPDFFRFCDELLEKYRDDERILMISGTNLASKKKSGKASYYFSRYPHIWGWASWRKRWMNYDVNMSRWPELMKNGFIEKLFENKQERLFWRNTFQAVFSGKVDTWDAQVVFMAFLTSSLSIFPKSNLISNIGFGADATHTVRKSSLEDIPALPLEWPLVHPERICHNIDAEMERKKKEGIGVSRWARRIQYLLYRIRSL